VKLKTFQHTFILLTTYLEPLHVEYLNFLFKNFHILWIRTPPPSPPKILIFSHFWKHPPTHPPKKKALVGRSVINLKTFYGLFTRKHNNVELSKCYLLSVSFKSLAIRAPQDLIIEGAPNLFAWSSSDTMTWWDFWLKLTSSYHLTSSWCPNCPTTKLAKANTHYRSKRVKENNKQNGLLRHMNLYMCVQINMKSCLLSFLPSFPSFPPSPNKVLLQ
jgi:hypothetical protein